MESNLRRMGEMAKRASSLMACAQTKEKNYALHLLSQFLIEDQFAVLEANRRDIELAKATNMSEAMLDRLSLKGRLEAISEDIKRIISLPDPVREVIEEKIVPSGLHLYKKRTPIGVIGVIYEARPNVTVDVAALTIKTGNCAILRGGKETLSSNVALIKIIHRALEAASLPKEAIQLVADPDRRQVAELLKMHETVDMIIPRGGAALHRFCRETSTIPVITGGIGICHLFVDESANIEKSIKVIYNAKTQRPTVCNALDTILVHRAIADKLIPQVIQGLKDAGVSFRLDQAAMQIVGNHPMGEIKKAEEEDWDTEWLSLVLGIKIVSGIDEAIDHIRKHSTGHSDGILTESVANADRFTDEVDSAAVYVNSSTRFTDGSEFGLGAEVAISTQKLHARGPMGLEELTSYKWVVKGDYHVRQ